MVRRRGSRKDYYDQHLARCKGPPAGDALGLSGPEEFSTAEEVESSTSLNPPIPDCKAEPTTACGSYTAAFQGPDGPYLLVYKDQEGIFHCRGSQDLEGELGERKSLKGLEWFRDVYDTHDEDYQFLDEDREEKHSHNFSSSIERRRTVSIAESEVLRGWYWGMFELIQQVPCKIIAKAWVRMVHPKKQGDSPYNGGQKARDLGLDENEAGKRTKPEWWPKKVKHKEPDHLDKWDRLTFLTTMLADKFGHSCKIEGGATLSVNLLKDATQEEEYRIKRLKNGHRAWYLLQEVFRIRKSEERFLNGNASERTTVTLNYYVFHDQKSRKKKTKSKAGAIGQRKVRKVSSDQNPVHEEDSDDDAEYSECDSYTNEDESYQETVASSDSRSLERVSIKQEPPGDISGCRALSVHISATSLSSPIAVSNLPDDSSVLSADTQCPVPVAESSRTVQAFHYPGMAQASVTLSSAEHYGTMPDCAMDQQYQQTKEALPYERGTMSDLANSDLNFPTSPERKGFWYRTAGALDNAELLLRGMHPSHIPYGDYAVDGDPAFQEPHHFAFGAVAQPSFAPQPCLAGRQGASMPGPIEKPFCVVCRYPHSP